MKFSPTQRHPFEAANRMYLTLTGPVSGLFYAVDLSFLLCIGECIHHFTTSKIKPWSVKNTAPRETNQFPASWAVPRSKQNTVP